MVTSQLQLIETALKRRRQWHIHPSFLGPVYPLEAGFFQPNLPSYMYPRDRTHLGYKNGGQGTSYDGLKVGFRVRKWCNVECHQLILSTDSAHTLHYKLVEYDVNKSLLALFVVESSSFGGGAVGAEVPLSMICLLLTKVGHQGQSCFGSRKQDRNLTPSTTRSYYMVARSSCLCHSCVSFFTLSYVRTVSSA